ncbi:peptidoglycan-binding domain-containing protein [Streptomyces sp. NPDC006700]|uniref:peptidoglycan-binding domain-containing protein n=1 Tax=unclassified Streptomyces TaxID=2593676 RepID=UPI0033C55F31
MSRIRRFTTTTLVASALAFGGVAATMAPAHAAPQPTTKSTQQASGWYCGYDNRVTPPTISYGSKGDTVREAQCLLLSLGYSVGPKGIDGDFGGNTLSAVKRFQSDYKVAGGADGIVGKNTWYGLRNF